jgi:hypothetical protein
VSGREAPGGSPGAAGVAGPAGGAAGDPSSVGARGGNRLSSARRRWRPNCRAVMRTGNAGGLGEGVRAVGRRIFGRGCPRRVPAAGRTWSARRGIDLPVTARPGGARAAEVCLGGSREGVERESDGGNRVGMKRGDSGDHGGRRNGREGHAALLFVLLANKEGGTRRWRPKESLVRARNQLVRPTARQRRLRSAATGACHWHKWRLSGDGHLASTEVRGSTWPRYCVVRVRVDRLL